MDELLARVESNPMNVPRSLFSNLDVVLFPMHIKKGERSMRRLANIVEMLELDRDSGDLIRTPSSNGNLISMSFSTRAAVSSLTRSKIPMV